MTDSNVDASPTAVASGTVDTASVPQILTKSDIPTLVTGLDASTAIECYLLQRTSYLHGIAESGIPITKSVIGLRYRPSSSDVLAAAAVLENRANFVTKGNNIKAPLSFELTLEYGPMRAGSGLMHESIPIVIKDTDGNANSNSNNNNNNENNGINTNSDNDDATTQSQFHSSFLSWDNESKVYFTRSITSQHYQTATYMASLSGAVLEHLLWIACDYPRRRYQPFTVVSTLTQSDSNNDNSKINVNTQQTSQQQQQLLLRSSSDTDFVQALWKELADIGVRLQPVMPPKLWNIQLHATQVQKIQATTSRSKIAQSYQALYQCIEAIATANVTQKVWATPTVSPTTIVSTNVTNETAIASDDDDDAYIPDAPQPPRDRRTEQDEVLYSSTSNNDNSDESSPSPTPDSSSTAGPVLDLMEASLGKFDTSDALFTANATQNLTDINAYVVDALIQGYNESVSDEYNYTSLYPGLPRTPSIAPTFFAQIPTASPVSHSEQAAQAAQQAAQAATQAEQSGNAQAAQAAQQAAQAAQQAAVVTATQEASMAREALLSGDGKTMTNVVGTCFRNLESNSNSTMRTFYLYWDGSFYFQVNLTPPYVSVAQIPVVLPQPPQVSGYTGGDWMDWSILMLFVLTGVVGSLLLIQQILGRNLRIFNSLYQCQKWFFDPTQHKDDETDEYLPDLGKGKGHDFGVDAIPFSMGGVRNPTSPSTRSRILWTKRNSSLKSNGEHDEDDSDQEDELGGHGDLELTVLGSSGVVTAADRLFKDPDFVDLPDLSRSSRIAVPVSLESDSIIDD